MNPEISSDGRYVVFYSYRSGTSQIYKLDLQNSYQVTRLTNDGASDYDPTFMPDGRILFKSNKADGYGDIWIMNADGSNLQNLTPSLSQTEEWKPDRISNTQIVFTSRLQQGNSNSDEIYTLNLSTGALVRITNNNVPDWYPAVDPSGTHIVFISKENQGDRDAIYTMGTDGLNRVRITDPSIIPADSDDPAWSPDGQSIIFINSQTGNYDVYVMDNKGGNLVPFEIAPSSVELSPLFIPGSLPTVFNGLAVNNSGFGTVTSDLGNINCGTVCSESYVTGTVVTLTATSQTGYRFAGWTGDCTGTALTCALTMGTAKTIGVSFSAKANQTITFGPVPTITVGSTGLFSATGGASGNPVTFSTTTSTVCTTSGTNGSTVIGVSAGTCTIAADEAGNGNYNAATEATQTFSVGKGNQNIFFSNIPPITLGGTGTLAAVGGASGNPVVFSSQTTNVCTLSGSTLTGKSVGTCSISANQAGNANYNAAQQVTTSFSVTPGLALAVINANLAFGNVISNVGGIVCGKTCSANFPSGSLVTLTAIPVSGYQFTGWGGACSGYGNSCTVTMSKAQTVTANFAVFKIHQPTWKRVVKSIIQGGG